MLREKRIFTYVLPLLALGASLTYLIWGKRKRALEAIDRSKLSIKRIYEKLDETRKAYKNNMLAPSCGIGASSEQSARDVDQSDGEDSSLQNWDQTRESHRSLISHREDIHRDCFKPVPEIIRSYHTEDNTAYKCQEILVETEDGFLLTLHRLPNSGPPILLQHGLLADSANWVSGGPEYGLAFILWRAGYDVYLGNSRGNPYSRRHICLNPCQPEFWHWTFQDLAKFDLPATIDKILTISTHERMWYVGHSQGSLIAFASLSEDKDDLISSKLYGVIALAPVCGLQYVKGPWKALCPSISKLIRSKLISSDLEFLPNSRAGRWIATMASKSPGSMRRFGFRSARNFLLTLANFDPERYIPSRLEVFLAHTPAGTSFRNIIHFAQNVGSTSISKLDFGNENTNVEHYGVPEPPKYDFCEIKSDLYLFVGHRDWLTTEEDAIEFISKFDEKNATKGRTIEGFFSDADHLDFIWGKDSHDKLYPKIISILDSYEYSPRTILESS